MAVATTAAQDSHNTTDHHTSTLVHTFRPTNQYMMHTNSSVCAARYGSSTTASANPYANASYLQEGARVWAGDRQRNPVRTRVMPEGGCGEGGEVHTVSRAPRERDLSSP
eukprot:160649-Chlamydomonas_euryale.AAC.3